MDAIWKFLKGYLTLPVLLSVLRAGLKAGAPLLVVNGLLPEEMVGPTITNILFLVGVVWGMASAKKPALPPAEAPKV